MFYRFLSVCLFVACCANVGAKEVPALQLAKTYQAVTAQKELNLEEYWVSEKLDGVRAYWDGKGLMSRGGNPIHAPSWFVAGLPKDVVMDGELWIARGKFELVSGTVRKNQPDDSEWKLVSYCIFDLPKHGGVFDQRVAEMRRVVKAQKTPWFRAVEQFRVKDLEELQLRLDQVVAAGAEGLMLHKGSATYQARRTNDLVKFKPLNDAEAVVVAHIEGKGKYQGMLGALVVEMPDGKRFKIGSGLSDQERKSPPAVGDTVTYQFNGLTKNGIPRFARFLRVHVVD